MAKLQPERSCNDTVFKYRLEASLVEAAKAQVMKVAGDNPVVFIATPLSETEVELMVLSSSLTPSQHARLDELQHNELMLQEIRAGSASSHVSLFGDD